MGVTERTQHHRRQRRAKRERRTVREQHKGQGRGQRGWEQLTCSQRLWLHMELPSQTRDTHEPAPLTATFASSSGSAVCTVTAPRDVHVPTPGTCITVRNKSDSAGVTEIEDRGVGTTSWTTCQIPRVLKSERGERKGRRDRGDRRTGCAAPGSETGGTWWPPEVRRAPG